MYCQMLRGWRDLKAVLLGCVTEHQQTLDQPTCFLTECARTKRGSVKVLVNNQSS